MTSWDASKNRRNIAKHGVDLALADGFDFETAIIEEDRDIDHEQRFRAIGLVRETMYFLVFALDDRGEPRVISMRRVTPRERRRYAEGP